MKSLRVRVLAITLAFSVLFANLLPFIAQYGDAKANVLSTLFGDKILLCTENGLQWVALNKFAPPTPKPHKEMACAACYLQANGSGKSLLPVYVFSFQPVEHFIAYRFFRTELFLALGGLSISRSRAPPLVSV